VNCSLAAWGPVAAGAASILAAALLLHARAPADAGAAAAPVATFEPVVAAGDRAAFARHLERNPRDGRAWVLLARSEFANDRFREAADAYAKALDMAPKVARDPAVWCEYADAMAMTQGGVLAGRPRELIAHALELDAAHPQALEMAGSAAYEARDFAHAARYWRQLLALLDIGSQAHAELAAAIARAERLR
jgi:cytochrome c-type biogenesis protein CcmH